MQLAEGPEPEGDTPDVRHLLPRPGEAAGAYAARLRALHDDLVLVLDAVERGLAVSDSGQEQDPMASRRAADVSAEPAGVPVPPVVRIAPVTTAQAQAQAQAPTPTPTPRAVARVEVVAPTRAAGAEVRHGRRAGDAAPLAARSARRLLAGAVGDVAVTAGTAMALTVVALLLALLLG